MRKLNIDELGRLSTEQYKRGSKIPVIIVLDNIRSLNNIGSVFRTADAFRVDQIFLCGLTACPPHKDIHKTALGATESVDWKYFEKTEHAIELLKSEGYRICAIEQTEGSTFLQDFTYDGRKLALVFGHEVKGVDQGIIDHSDVSIEIPQFGTKHSLNISVSAGIVLWDIFQKIQKKEPL